MAQHFGNIDFKELLPSVLQNDEGVKNAADAINPELKKSAWGIPQILLMSRLALGSSKSMSDIGVLAPFGRLCDARGIDLEKLNETELDLLAWQLHVDLYSCAVGIDAKREMVTNTIKRHRVKGTVGAVKGILRDVYGETNPDISEWFQYGGKPYTFRVSFQVPDSGLDQDTVDNIIALVLEYKNVRSWVEVFVTAKDQRPVNEYIAFSSVVKTSAEIVLRQSEDVEIPMTEYRAFAIAESTTASTVVWNQGDIQTEFPLNFTVGAGSVVKTSSQVQLYQETGGTDETDVTDGASVTETTDTTNF